MYKPAIEEALKKIEANITHFNSEFPHTSEDKKYVLNPNTNWTNGFWVGLLWQAYEVSQESVFKNAAQLYTRLMEERLTENRGLDTHDIGFLYTPSVVAEWQIKEKPESKDFGIKAADRLMERYRENIGIIQAWGPLGDPTQGGRIIIDCLMNMPLLFWASEKTGKDNYKNAAIAFIDKARRYLIRGDDSSYHTFYFNQETGQPEKGATQQGYADGSTWTRGQAWAIYGFALAYRYTGDKNYLETSLRTAKFFVDHLPEHFVAYWDFDAPVDDTIKPDSSASAIAACGFHELLDLLDGSSEYDWIKEALNKTMDALISDYTTEEDSQGLIDHGSYSVREGKSPDSYTIWGDYFYFEALLRLEHNLRGYWYESKKDSN
ncbi:glycoside hydrolase family 88 protein [Alkalibacterium iburiense]|uniref:Glycoside hydrolase family 88 protein n=1 Tax=Alkalibacterium iburiense TaxID=290589 RepID=A0ABP3GWJ9_9LACT